jgi:hypothetical protein
MKYLSLHVMHLTINQLRPSALFNRTNVTYDNILCIQEYSDVYNNAVRTVTYEGLPSYFRRGKHMHDRIISLRGDLRAHKVN